MTIDMTREALRSLYYEGDRSSECDAALAAHEAAVRADELRAAADALPGGIWPIVAIPGINGAVKTLRDRAARIEEVDR